MLKSCLSCEQAERWPKPHCQQQYDWYCNGRKIDPFTAWKSCCVVRIENHVLIRRKRVKLPSFLL